MSFSIEHTTNWRTRNGKLPFFRKTEQIKQGVNWVRRVMAIDDRLFQNLSYWA
jgi:hypothetical protein